MYTYDIIEERKKTKQNKTKQNTTYDPACVMANAEEKVQNLKARLLQHESSPATLQ
jgi:hypothetical protein